MFLYFIWVKVANSKVSEDITLINVKNLELLDWNLEKYMLRNIHLPEVHPLDNFS